MRACGLPVGMRVCVLPINANHDVAAIQELDLGEEQWAGKPIELKFTSFQNVSTLSLFVKENVTGDEDETTCISNLVVMGFTTALEGRKRSLEEQKAAQAGDWLNSK